MRGSRRTSEGKLKRRTGTIIRYGPRSPAVILNNRTADRQPHPHSLWLGRVEGVEDFFEILLVYSITEVLHSDEHLVGFMLTRTNKHLPRSVRDSIHGFDTVHHQIKNHLLQLDTIAQYAGETGSQFHLQHHAGFLYFAVSQTDNLLDGFVNVQKRLLSVAFFDQCADASDHFASPVAVSDNSRYRFPRLV